ncbi:hypothetical protein CTA2_10794 [Colletotrichum tanaceti]|uniref:BTB domain-containing protein n=1 Tax=Colletotrichum tanaceti TaxID=1306861 RepID=A0A4U6XJE6_9PEZI|nr:hypothetical protein CTA2_10807 [Colletotrichum tanaceti]KAJ0168836.1 hypothetical protein CTA2_10794 [Colletotrichum tanaceti]TKW56035.1 hypothetical protein CTA1_7729 [Colletotrichum tanaceti]
MSYKRYRGKHIASTSSSGAKIIRKGRFSALFGRGSERAGDTARDTARDTAQHPTASKKEELIKSDPIQSPVQDQKLQEFSDPHKNNGDGKMDRRLDPVSVTAHHASGEKMAMGLNTDPAASTNSSAGNNTETVDFAKLSQYSIVSEGTDNRSTVGQASDNDSSAINASHETVPSLVTPSRGMKPLIHRHKRASSSFKIVDKTSADAVVLPGSSCTPSPNDDPDSRSGKKHVGANGETQAVVFDQPSKPDQKQCEEFHILPSTSYTAGGFPRSPIKPFQSGKTTADDTHPLSSTTFKAPKALFKVPKTQCNDSAAAEEDPILSSNSYTEPGPVLEMPRGDEASFEGNQHLHSTSCSASTLLHGVLRTTSLEKTLAEKKVRFDIASSSKYESGGSENGDSDGPDKTVKPDVVGMKGAHESFLSPVIWNKGSEPKIWMKDGKPTLFQPKKEPSHYTNPLWSRQYPEILSNDQGVHPHVIKHAESTTSTDGSRYSKTPATNSSAKFDRNANLHMNSDTIASMSFGASTPNTGAAFTRTPGNQNTSPIPPNQSFFGRNFPEQPNLPTGFALTPRYRSQVKLEVGGRRFVTSFEILEKSPWFRQLFSIDFRNWYCDGVFHIENDGDLFAHILRYLRTDLYPLFWDTRNGFDYATYSMIMQQAHHYMLYDLEAWIAARKFHEVVEIQVVHQKLMIPHDQAWIHDQRLMGNHSYTISGVVEESPGHKGKGEDVEGLKVNMGGMVALFTTENMVNVDMDKLRRV